ncbi:MAG TPA: DUF308 domain-containing protein [Streptosporangiaceae bacterium]|jgi:uncharacterized membrane protein HdeD (DUF308 family)
MTISGTGLGGDTTPRRASALALGNTWGALLGTGVVLLALGIILLVWPHGTVVVFAVLIGIALLLTGIIRLVQGLTASDASGGKRVAYVVIGILAGLAGLYCIRHVNVTVAILGVVVGLFWTMHGVVDLVLAAGPGDRADRVLTGIMGVLSLVFGVLAIFWPSETLTVLVVLMGIWLLLDGLLFCLMAWQVRRAAAHAGPLSRTADAVPPQQAGAGDPLR